MKTERFLTEKSNLFLSDEQESTLSVVALHRYAQGWLLQCDLTCSRSTLANRRIYVRNLFWFLNKNNCASCGVMELRSFFAYFNTGHTDPEGRWNNPQEKYPVKPSTVATYHRHISALFRWLVAEGFLIKSPMERVKIAPDRADQVEPFTEEQVSALLYAASRSRHARRDTAILYFLLDTGIRASELCALRFRDVDISGKFARVVEGKGGKSRTIYFNKTAGKALWQYLSQDGREPEESVFLSERGDQLTRSGLQQMLKRLAKEAGISSARVSPHTFRHTMAVSFLRNGGQQFALMQMLGHTDLKMTARYVKLAQADVERQARQFSPADNLRGKKR